MSSYQFPPSSPLRSIEEAEPFSQKKSQDSFRGRAAYPTPNPSSSIFRSSSPVAALPDSEPEVVIKEKKRVQFEKGPFAKVDINADFNVLNPDSSVVRIPLIESQSKITIGRSSKSCDFYFGSNDMNVSRSHISVCYNSEQLVLTCLGRNGLAVRIPRSCYVYATNSKDNYIITENTSGVPLSFEDSMKVHKSIRIDANHTEFTLNKKETITLPRFNNILLEINQHIILLNPLDLQEDLTDEEELTLITEPTEKQLVTPRKVPIERFPEPETPFKVTNKSPEEISKSNEITPSKPPVKLAQPKAQVAQKPQVQEHAQPQEHISQKQASVSKPPQPATFKIFEDKVKKDLPVKIEEPKVKNDIIRSSTPLSDKSNTYSNPSTPKRKAQSEEPPKSRKKTKNTEASQKVEIVQEWIEGIENVEEINNILINHLAFSRLSSTPASFLKTISVLTSNLSLRQIRVLLHNISCIGVIYRQGKDAAGKPLEEEYYYMPENDTDSHRINLVSSIKGHGGLRSCRRTHKQYYWKKPAPIKK